MVIRCGQCGSNNNSGNRLCLTCGADLLEFAEELPARPMSPEPRELTSVRGSSMARPTAGPTNSVIYRSQSGVTASHLGRHLVLILFTLTVAGACWHWQDLRMLASRSSQTPDMSQSKEPNSIPAPAPIPPLEVQTPQSAHPAPSELASQPDQSATEETSSQEPLQEGSVRSSKSKIQPLSATEPGDTSETAGEKYLYGDGVQVDCGRARQDFLAAAEHSSTKAQSTLGTMYATGHCANRDLPLAYHWFARAQRQEPRNRIIQEDMKALWNQMSPEERRLARR
jgi:hypothetical protein